MGWHGKPKVLQCEVSVGGFGSFTSLGWYTGCLTGAGSGRAWQELFTGFEHTLGLRVRVGNGSLGHSPDWVECRLGYSRY